MPKLIAKHLFFENAPMAASTSLNQSVQTIVINPVSCSFQATLFSQHLFRGSQKKIHPLPSDEQQKLLGLGKLTNLLPHKLEECLVQLLKEIKSLYHISFNQECSSILNVRFKNSNKPYFILYRGQWVYLFLAGCPRAWHPFGINVFQIEIKSTCNC